MGARNFLKSQSEVFNDIFTASGKTAAEKKSAAAFYDDMITRLDKEAAPFGIKPDTALTRKINEAKDTLADDVSTLERGQRWTYCGIQVEGICRKNI